MNKKYRVVFLGLIEAENNFRQRMSSFGVPLEMIDKIIDMAPVIMKADMPLRDARQYADVIQNAGGRVNIQEHGYFEGTRSTDNSFDIEPFENFIMCPECGHKQRKIEVCVKCGNIFIED